LEKESQAGKEQIKVPEAGKSLTCSRTSSEGRKEEHKVTPRDGRVPDFVGQERTWEFIQEQGEAIEGY
jgi:hypothetical protein